MELTIPERLVLLDVLPKEGDFTTLKIIRTLREALSFSEEEHKACPITVEDGFANWDPALAFEADIPIGEKATDVIVAALKALDEKKKLGDQHYTLYVKFIGE